MADQKVSDLPSLNGADVDAADLLYIIDSSAGSAGSKKITVGQYQLAPVSGGTANGVLYLNASKVATAGSDLVFDGTNFSTTGTASATKLIPTGGSATGNGMFLPAANTLGFSTNGTQAMTLDASGNLALTQTRTYNASANIALEIGGTDNGFVDNGRTSSWRQYVAGDAANGQSLRFDGFVRGTGWTERARITSGGDLLVGSTDSTLGKFAVRGVETTAYNTATFGNGTDVQSLDVVCGRALTNGTVGGVASSLVMTLRSSGSFAGDMAFATGNNEIARITSTGNVLVGTTSTAGAGGLTLQSIVSGYAIVNNNNAGATGYVFESFRRSSTEIGSITQNGTTAVQYNTTSDRRLKDNIAPAPSASDVIDAIEIVSHDWKAAPDEHVTYGVIAQDLAVVAPQAVLQGDDGDEIEKTWGVDYSKLVPMLIKEIQSLRARVAALESA